MGETEPVRKKNSQYNNLEDQLNEIYEDISNGIKIGRSFNCMNLVKNQTSAS